jgi:predicted MFS family arabinose efflux permease
LRGLGFSISILNLVGGTFTIVVPLIILERLHLNVSVVGLVMAVQGLSGVVSAIVFGRVDSRNRERAMLAVPMVGMGVAVAILLLSSNLTVLVLVMGITGFLNGPLDVALFTLRQRRTDPAWTGRAFAVSMSFNYLGVPVGSAFTGIIAARSIEAAIAFAVVTCFVSGIVAIRMIPTRQLS